MVRLIHPTRAEVPGSASSIAAIASKWLRLGAGRPTACTAPKVLFSHIGSSGANSGCSPNLGSDPSRLPTGTAMPGRSRRNRSWSALERGTTKDSPSEPPRSDSTTRTFAPMAAP